MSKVPLSQLLARGKFPVKFPFRDAHWDEQVRGIPGVVIRPDSYRATFDASLVLHQMFGLDMPEVPSETADLPGIEAFRARGLAQTLRAYQWRAATFLANRPWAILGDPMRCLDGDTVVIGAGRRCTLRELYRQEMRPRVACYDEEGSIITNELVATHHVGRKEGFEVLVGGKKIIASSEHKFRTPTGYIELSKLRIGDLVLMREKSAAVPHPIESITSVGMRDMYDLTLKSPLNNYVANDFIVHNSGKTLSTLAALVLADAQRVCVVCPSIAKWVWAAQIARWLGESALILEGRSMREARAFCVTCEGIGRIDGKRCPDCRLRNGASYGYRLYQVETLRVEGTDGWHCPKHPEVVSNDSQRLCPMCQTELEDVVCGSRFVIANYDVLVPQRANAGGRKVFRSDMPGLGAFLAAAGFDSLVVDEAHMLRARLRKTANERARGDEKKFRADAIQEIGRDVERFWMVTGTPVYAYLRDLYMLLHLASGGVWGSEWQFDAYYCNGHKGEYGWSNTGKSWKAESELPWRLKYYVLKRELADIRPELPKKQYDVRWYDPPPGLKVRKVKGDPLEAWEKAIENTSRVKFEGVVEECLREMSEGRKVVVFCYYRARSIKYFKEFEHAIKKSRQWKARMQQVGAEVWLADGSVSSKNRVAMGEAFVRHESAGVFVATIEAFQVAVSLAGASAVHFAELHPVPGAVLQAAARPEDGTTPLTVIFHAVKESVDAGSIRDLQEKIAQIDMAVGDKDATRLAAEFGHDEEDKRAKAERLMAKLLADLQLDDDE